LAKLKNFSNTKSATTIITAIHHGKSSGADRLAARSATANKYLIVLSYLTPASLANLSIFCNP
jgi:hypothetical protein